MTAMFRPWRRAADLWWGTVHLIVGMTVFGIVVSWSLFALGVSAASLLVVFPFALPVIWLFFASTRLVSWLQRSRFAALLGVELVDPVPPLTGRTWWQRLKERMRSRQRWYEVLHAIGWGWVNLVMGVVVMTVWCGSAVLAVLPLYVSGLPGGTAKFWLFDAGPGLSWLVAAVGVIGLAVAAPWCTWALVQLDVAVTRRLLDRRPGDDAEERLARAEAGRSAAVDAAEVERRRIERDLHDGAQQRIVALGMSLGAALEKLDDDLTAGKQLVAEAHRDAKEALSELRELVRGIHPAILEDRGLDAALSSVVARMPFPVRLQIEVVERPPAAVESAAYFVVVEALTNAARYSQASEATVIIATTAGRLVAEVSDDGVGGADESRGTGLSGLRNRAEALEGRLHVLSPPGGPTTVLAELPYRSTERRETARTGERSGGGPEGEAE